MKKKIGMLVVLSFLLMVTVSAYGAPVVKNTNLKGLNFLNNCTVKELIQIKGIGTKTATAIIAYRDSLKSKKFKTYKELLKIKNEKGKLVFVKKDGNPNKKFEKAVKAIKNGIGNAKTLNSNKKVIKTKKVTKTKKSALSVPKVKTVKKVVKKAKKIKKNKKIKKTPAKSTTK